MIGRFATSKAGHDKSQLYVIVAQEGDFVYLCDGRNKPLDKPKKKRKKHVQLINKSVEPSLLECLKNGDVVRDEEIKYAIKCYESKRMNKVEDMYV